MTRVPETRKLLPGALLATVAVVLLLVGTPFASGKFTTKVTNSTNSSATAVFPCTARAVAATAYFVYPLQERSGSTVAADFSGQNRAGTYQNTAGITFGDPGPCPRDGAKAITLNGTSGNVSGATATTRSAATFTEEIWFKTTTTTGGKLIGLGNTQGTSSTDYDRHIYMTNAGTLVFGVYPGGFKTVTSKSAYNDGNWHQVVASLDPTVGMGLYVDGNQVASDPATTTAYTYPGTSYWRIGYDNLSGWLNQPSSFYFKGSLAYASVYTTALTLAQIQAQYNAGK